ncbi:MAG: Trm112 family protein [Gammaproteobacteria bacterium]|nr:Trm112 family protein [Gammaproteobacteria bacterium]
MFNRKLLELLVCPVSKAPLVYRSQSEELWCSASGLAYAIADGIPVLIAEEARELSPEERETLREGG